MGILIVILITLLATANGTLLSYLVIGQLPLAARLCAGSVVGLAVLSWLGFLNSLLFGLNTTSIGLTVTVLVIGLTAQLRLVKLTGVRDDLRAICLSKSGVIYYGAWTVLLVWLFGRVMMFYPDGMHTAPANNFGDLPFHLSVITSFAFGENLPPQNPIFAEMKFTYPFLIDFLTAFFIRCGVDWRAAFFVENIVLSLSLVALIDLMTLRLTGNKIAALIAPVIFLFNGGFGFINFFHDLRQFWADPDQLKEGLIWFFAHLPKTYTMNAELILSSTSGDKVPLRWGNVFTTLLIPQRSMLFGLPFVAMIITLWWMAVRENGGRGDGETGGDEPISPRPPVTPSPSPYFLAAGILTGLLPMLHAHGFFAVMIASALMAMLFWTRRWIAFFAPVVLLAGPQVWWLSGTQVRNILFKLQWWKEAGESDLLTFWAVNAGVFLALLIGALLTYKTVDWRVKRFYLPFLSWFIVPNVMLLAPWSWDNIKVLIYWSLASCPLVAVMLAYIFTRRIPILRISAAVLLIVMTLSGSLDVLRAASPVENALLFGKDQIEVGSLLREKTPPRSVILHAPVHNSVVALSGRQSVMGYPGHLWTHGIAYEQRELEIGAVYRGGADAAEILSRLNVDYLVVGPIERTQLVVDENYFASRYPLVIDHSGYRIYQVSPQ